MPPDPHRLDGDNDGVGCEGGSSGGGGNGNNNAAVLLPQVNVKGKLIASEER